MNLTMSDGLLIAAIAASFSCGLTFATLAGKIDRALRAAQRAHIRLDELEQQTGTYTVLRAESPDEPRPPRKRRFRGS